MPDLWTEAPAPAGPERGPSEQTLDAPRPSPALDIGATGISPDIARPIVFGLENAYGPAWQQDYGTVAGRTLTGATPADAFPDAATPERQQYRDTLAHILSPGEQGADHPDVQAVLRGALAVGMAQPDRAVVNRSALSAAVERDPEALLRRGPEIPRDQLVAWRALAMKQVPQSVLGSMAAMNAQSPERAAYNIRMRFRERGEVVLPPSDWRPLDVRRASGGMVNMDYFAVTTRLPRGTDPGVLLNQVRKDLNGTVDTDRSSFSTYPNQPGGGDNARLWNSTSPTGSFVHIEIPATVVHTRLGSVRVPGNDGTVAVIDSATDHWTFATVQSPMDGLHPVSGNRQFGYTENPDGTVTFYTRGVDRITDPATQFVNAVTGGAIEGGSPGVAFAGADALWQSFQQGIAQRVRDAGGTARVEAPIVRRPDWDAVDDVLTGRETVETFLARQSRQR